MAQSNAKVTGTDSSVCLTYGKNSLTLFKSDLDRLIDEYIPQEKFISMACDMLDDYLKAENYDWTYDRREAERRFAIVYNNAI